MKLSQIILIKSNTVRQIWSYPKTANGKTNLVPITSLNLPTLFIPASFSLHVLALVVVEVVKRPNLLSMPISFGQEVSDGVESFIRSCIPFLSKSGAEKEPRPFGPFVYGTKAKDIVQLD